MPIQVAIWVAKLLLYRFPHDRATRGDGARRPECLKLTPRPTAMLTTWSSFAPDLFVPRRSQQSKDRLESTQTTFAVSARLPHMSRDLSGGSVNCTMALC